MRQILIKDGEAPKIGGEGTLVYQLWVDEGGRLYVQIIRNAEGGSFPRHFFSVAMYASRRNSKNLGQIVGLDLDMNEQVVEDNNGDGFLRAVLRHLLDGGDLA